jgi:hypothetical protein
MNANGIYTDEELTPCEGCGEMFSLDELNKVMVKQGEMKGYLQGEYCDECERKWGDRLGHRCRQ